MIFRVLVAPIAHVLPWTGNASGGRKGFRANELMQEAGLRDGEYADCARQRWFAESMYSGAIQYLTVYCLPVRSFGSFCSRYGGKCGLKFVSGGL